MSEIETEHGSIEYQVVECLGCGEKIAKQNARTVITGDVAGVREKAYTYVRYESDTVQIAHICSECDGIEAQLNIGVADGLTERVSWSEVHAISGFVAGVILMAILIQSGVIP